MQPNQAALLAEMALDIAAQPDIEQTLDHIVAHARRAVACDAVGIVLVKRGQPSTVIVTEPAVRRADELQVLGGDGPLFRPSEETDCVLVADTRTDTRWPEWSRQVAAELGWLSVLSVRLFTGTQTLGALNLYSAAVSAFSTHDLQLARIFGRHAAIALVKRQEAENLREAVRARHVIGQAQGILMERYSIDAERAFSVLRRYSQNSNKKVRQVAEEVVRSRRLPPARSSGPDNDSEVVLDN